MRGAAISRGTAAAEPCADGTVGRAVCCCIDWCFRAQESPAWKGTSAKCSFVETRLGEEEKT